MLIQRRDERLRLIPQHEHGLQAGELAAAWVGRPGSGGPVSRELVLATALHDLAWRDLDRVPRRDPETGRPLSFLEFPAGDKYRAASEALDRIEALHPYAAVLVSLHYTSFGSPDRPAAFEESEEERRLELLDDLGEDAPGPRAIRRDLKRLRLFDNLSLFLCLTPPGASEEGRPPWLRPGLLRAPEGGVELSLSWRDEVTAVLDPFPFATDPVEVSVECRDLATNGFDSDEALAEAWERADAYRWSVRLLPG